MNKSDPNTDYTDAATFVLEGVQATENTEGMDAANGEYLILSKNKALLQLAREYLIIADGQIEMVREWMQVLLLELRDLREIAQRGNSRRGNSERDRLSHSQIVL